jgi:uroporphyrinogen decarboxylase
MYNYGIVVTQAGRLWPRRRQQPNTSAQGEGGEKDRDRRAAYQRPADVDTQTPAAFARAEAPAGMPLQGNLDPQLLICDGAALEGGARQVLGAFAASPHIFNLGHGITPQTPPENVAALVGMIRRGR